MGKKNRRNKDTDQTTYHFKVSYRKQKGGAGGTLDYRAGSIREVLKILNESEDVNTANTDYLVIHQIMENGDVKELLGHDKASGTCTIDFRHLPASPPSPRKLRKKIKKQEHWTLGYDEEETIEAIGQILIAARNGEPVDVPAATPPAKPRIRLKSPPIVPTKVAGFFYTAQEARATHQPSEV